MDINWRSMAALLLAIMAIGGCANERVYRCNEKGHPLLSGRYDSCASASTHCHLCGKRAGHCFGHPLVYLKEKLFCNGCGDIFFDEWLSDPPDKCDPCDDCHGDWVGERCCPPKMLHRVGAMFVGGRCSDQTCSHAGCGSACGPTNNAEFVGEEVAESQPEPYYEPQSAPAKKRTPTPAPKVSPRTLPEETLPEPNESEVDPFDKPADKVPMPPENNREAARKSRPAGLSPLKTGTVTRISSQDQSPVRTATHRAYK